MDKERTLKNVETDFNNLKKAIKQVYGFSVVKDGKVVPPKITFPKAVYDRVEMFGGENAGMAGWTIYGSLKLIMGECSRKDYEMNAIGDESMFEPSKEFKKWLDENYHFGPVMIMVALIYGNYELEDEQHGQE